MEQPVAFWDRVTLCMGEQEYTRTQMLAMSEDDFSSLLIEYDELRKRLVESQCSLETLAFVLEIMENVVLTRRIRKLEEKISALQTQLPKK